jgi:AraC family transcriptional regulator
MASHNDGSRLVRERKVSGYHFIEVLYPAGLRQPRHVHSRASFSLVTLGRYEESYTRQVHRRHAATLVMHPADEVHSVVFESDVRILSIETAGSEYPSTPDQREGCRTELIALLASRLVLELNRTDAAAPLAIDGLMSELLSESTRQNRIVSERGVPRWLVTARDFVHDNFGVPFTVNQVADVVKIHPVHLSRVFRQRMGCTVGEYVRRLRLERACSQILESHNALCDIALDAGYSDQSHFNRHFRAHFGVTPHQYRKLHSTAAC